MPLPHKKNPRIITPHAQSIRVKSRSNVDIFVQKMFKIAPKVGGTPVDFTYNWTQDFVAERLREKEKQLIPIREYYLKRRRVGLTSFLAGRNMARAMVFDNRRIGIIAHQDERAQEILAAYKFYYDHLDEELQFPYARNFLSGLKFLHFFSAVIVGTAENPEKIRGDGLHDVHLSETSYFRDFNRVMDEVCPVVPYEPGTSIILETTGKLRGSAAHQFWESCKANEEGYDPIFLNWRDDPTAVKQLSDEAHSKMMHEILNREPDLAAKFKFFNLNAGQMAWAYERFVQHTRRNYIKFGTEYPMDEEEAWSVTGLSYFGETNIRKLKAEEPLEIYCWRGMSLRTSFKSPAELTKVDYWKDDNSGEPYIKIWKAPYTSSKYVIGSDTSVGESNSAFSAGYVIDAYTREMVASFHGRLRFDEHAMIAGCLGEYYNNACVAPEWNNSGMAVCYELHKWYPNVYRWRKTDADKMVETHHLGWQTTRTTRPRMLSEILKLIEDIARGELEDIGMFRDKALLDEFRTFCEDPSTGQPSAVRGSTDDRIFGLAIAHMVSYQLSYGSNMDMYSNYEKIAEKMEQYKPDPAREWINKYNALNEGNAVDKVRDLFSTKDKTMVLKDGIVRWENSNKWLQ